MEVRYRLVTVHVCNVAPLRPKADRWKIENERLQQCAGCSATARQHVDEVFLIGLSKSQPIDHPLLSELGETRHIPPKGALENMTVDLGAVEHPP
jgi:hypothetical protein